MRVRKIYIKADVRRFQCSNITAYHFVRWLREKRPERAHAPHQITSVLFPVLHRKVTAHTSSFKKPTIHVPSSTKTTFWRRLYSFIFIVYMYLGKCNRKIQFLLLNSFYVTSILSCANTTKQQTLKKSTYMNDNLVKWHVKKFISYVNAYKLCKINIDVLS